MQNVQIAKITKTKELIFSAVFTALAVYAPAAIHYFAGIDGGRTYLPMPFFVLLAGILFGWRTGLATAIMSPMVSYLISGMPMLDILPFITVQMIAFGVAAGLLRNRLNFVYANAGAIFVGWTAIGIALVLFSKIGALHYIASGIRLGFLGILLQLILIPLITIGARRLQK